MRQLIYFPWKSCVTKQKYLIVQWRHQTGVIGGCIPLKLHNFFWESVLNDTFFSDSDVVHWTMTNNLYYLHHFLLEANALLLVKFIFLNSSIYIFSLMEFTRRWFPFGVATALSGIFLLWREIFRENLSIDACLIIDVTKQLEAQKAEPVSLTWHEQV